MLKKNLFILGLILCAYSSFSQLVIQSQISEASRGQYSTFIDSNGNEWSVGDTLVFGRPANNESYDYIQAGGVLTPVANLRGTFKETKTFIKNIRVLGNARSRQVVFYIKHPVGTDLCFAYAQNAIDSGELLKKGVLTREQAIEELKESKELVELGLKSEEEHQELVKNLKPIIMK